MIVAPPSAQGTPWARKFGPVSYALASGWMTIRGTRRRKAVDRGFVLSDHVDWPGLLGAIEATGAGRVLVTHGYTSVVVRWLREKGHRRRGRRRPATKANATTSGRGRGRPETPERRRGIAQAFPAIPEA